MQFCIENYLIKGGEITLIWYSPFWSILGENLKISLSELHAFRRGEDLEQKCEVSHFFYQLKTSLTLS